MPCSTFLGHGAYSEPCKRRRSSPKGRISARSPPWHQQNEACETPSCGQPAPVVLAPNLDWRRRLPRWDVRNWPVMEEDDEGVKFVCSSSTLTFASVTYNNGHILLVVDVGRCQGGRCPHPSSCTWKMHCTGRGSIPLVIFPQTYKKPEVPPATSFRRCAFMICVSVFIL